MRFDAESDTESLFYKTQNLVRGNRIYTMMVMGHVSKKEEEGPDHFFKSLKLEELKKTVFTVQTADNLSFSSMAPDKFVRATDEEEEDFL